jgi:hypothetical protein
MTRLNRPTTYVVCTNDRAIPAERQRRMARRDQSVLELPTDHSPFLTQPHTLAGLLADTVVAARSFEPTNVRSRGDDDQPRSITAPHHPSSL